MYVLVVYGAPHGRARPPAIRLARALRRLRTPTQVRPAGRVARLHGATTLVVAIDRDGATEIAELLESFGLSTGLPPVYGLRVDDAPLPAGVSALPGTRRDGEVPRDPGAALRLASRLSVAVRRAAGPGTAL